MLWSLFPYLLVLPLIKILGPPYNLLHTVEPLPLLSIYRVYTYYSPRLDHIFIRLGPAPPMPLSVPGLLAHICMGTLPRWEPMWQCSIAQAIKFLWHVKELHQLIGNNESDANFNSCNFDRVLLHWFPMRRSTHAGAGRKTEQWKRCGRDGPQPNEDVI